MGCVMKGELCQSDTVKARKKKTVSKYYSLTLFNSKIKKKPPERQ